MSCLCHTLSVSSFPMSSSYVYRTVRVRLADMSDTAKAAVWQLRSEQSQAFNLGVELALASSEKDGKVLSSYDAFAELTVRRRSGEMPTDVTVELQRGGVSAGVDAVTKWHATVERHAASVEYWRGRVEAAARGETLGYDDAAEYSKGRLDRALERQRRHAEKGTGRLFRSRKRMERDPSRGAACVWLEGVRVDGGRVRFPGGLCLPLAEGWGPLEGWEFSGAAQLVDTTARVTRRTLPTHRRYTLHLSLRRPVTEPAVPDGPEQIVGVDAGVVVNVACSDGRQLSLPDTTALDEQIRDTAQQRSRRVYGSRGWKRATRQLRRLYARRNGLVDNSMRHLAKQVAATPDIAAVAVENTNNRGMMAGAAGTAKHPGRNVAAKRGLNRSLHRSRYAGVRRAIARSCQLNGLAFITVNPAGTSQICHRCGTVGQRESQAVFSCTSPECGWRGNADHNAATNVRTRTWRTIQQQQRDAVGGRDSRRKTAAAGKPQPKTKTIPNKQKTDSTAVKSTI